MFFFFFFEKETILKIYWIKIESKYKASTAGGRWILNPNDIAQNISTNKLVNYMDMISLIMTCDCFSSASDCDPLFILQLISCPNECLEVLYFLQTFLGSTNQRLPFHGLRNCPFSRKSHALYLLMAIAISVWKSILY